MKFEYIGCCFRIELELFEAKPSWREFRPARQPTPSDLKRGLWRQVRTELACERQPVLSKTQPG